MGTHTGGEEPPQAEHGPPQARGTRRPPQGPPERPAHLFWPCQASRAGCERVQLSPPSEQHRITAAGTQRQKYHRAQLPAENQNTPHDSKKTTRTDPVAPQDEGIHTQGHQNSSQLMHVSQEGRRGTESQQDTNRTSRNKNTDLKRKATPNAINDDGNRNQSNKNEEVKETLLKDKQIT